MSSMKITMTQAAREYGVSRQAIMQAIQSGRLKAIKVESPLVATGWLYMFQRKDFERAFKKVISDGDYA